MDTNKPAPVGTPAWHLSESTQDLGSQSVVNRDCSVSAAPIIIIGNAETLIIIMGEFSLSLSGIFGSSRLNGICTISMGPIDLESGSHSQRPEQHGCPVWGTSRTSRTLAENKAIDK